MEEHKELFEPHRLGRPKDALICAAENLQAFESEASLMAFHASQCPSASILEKWLCKACGRWHFDATAPDPAGSTSGTTRSKRHTPRKRLKFFERTEGGRLYALMDAKQEPVKHKGQFDKKAKSPIPSGLDDRDEEKRIQKEMREESGVY